MALRACKECGKPVSSKGRHCPHCGAPTPQTEATQIAGGLCGIGCVLWLLVPVLILLATIWLSGC
jgi:endogenous inhibitor of DNA gyrase (YacG/DUF329 family)